MIWAGKVLVNEVRTTSPRPISVRLPDNRQLFS
jgi:hypothetical protein